MRVPWLLMFWFSPAFAQTAPWFNVDGAYVRREVKEENGPTLTSVRAGGRGEIGFGLGKYLAVSGGGSYHDGVGEISGSTKATHSSGYAADTRALAHLIYGWISVCGGVAEFESFENAGGLYRERLKITYKPVGATIHWGAAYARYETMLSSKASLARTYSDQGAGHADLRFDLPKARQQVFEIGFVLPSTRWSTRVFVNQTRWTLDASALPSDGIIAGAPGRTVVTTTFAGMGFGF